MLKHIAESEAALAARFPKALERTCDGSWKPGLERTNVFDFEDGLRLIISRDDIEGAPFGIHVSASLNPKSELYSLMSSGAILPSLMQGSGVPERCKRLFGLTGLKLMYISEDSGIPHWWKEEKRP